MTLKTALIRKIPVPKNKGKKMISRRLGDNFFKEVKNEKNKIQNKMRSRKSLSKSELWWRMKLTERRVRIKMIKIDCPNVIDG